MITDSDLLSLEISEQVMIMQSFSQLAMSNHSWPRRKTLVADFSTRVAATWKGSQKCKGRGGYHANSSTWVAPNVASFLSHGHARNDHCIEQKSLKESLIREYEAVEFAMSKFEHVNAARQAAIDQCRQFSAGRRRRITTTTHPPLPSPSTHQCLMNVRTVLQNGKSSGAIVMSSS